MRYVISERYEGIDYGDLVAIGEDKFLVCRDYDNDEVVLLDIETSVINRVGCGSFEEIEKEVDYIVALSIDLILQKRD